MSKIEVGDNVDNCLSKCCDAPIKTSMSPDFIGEDPEKQEIGTCCFMCTKCGKPCNVYIEGEEKEGEKMGRAVRYLKGGIENNTEYIENTKKRIKNLEEEIKDRKKIIKEAEQSNKDLEEAVRKLEE